MNTVHYVCADLGEPGHTMTISERKMREREEMRSLILDGARQIFLEKGYAQTSIRNIAEKIEYSPGTIYLYFRDKDEICHALHEEGFRRMLAQMQPLQHVADPMERLRAMGRVYLDFARRNKDFYDLMFIMDSPMDHEKDQAKWAMGQQTLGLLKEVLRSCQERGHFAGRNLDYLSFIIWSAMHGMCALYIRERCQAYPDMDGNVLIDHGYQYFIDMLEKL